MNLELRSFINLNAKEVPILIQSNENDSDNQCFLVQIKQQGVTDVVILNNGKEWIMLPGSAPYELRNLMDALVKLIQSKLF